jgi:hypothetical protein
MSEALLWQAKEQLKNTADRGLCQFNQLKKVRVRPAHLYFVTVDNDFNLPFQRGSR